MDLRDLWDSTEMIDISVTRVLEGKEKQCGS